MTGSSAAASEDHQRTLADTPTLGWKLPERLKAFDQIAAQVQRAHEEGRVVGTLQPDRILLDDNSTPLLPRPGLAPAHGPYAAPDPMKDDPRSDIFSLGRLLHFCVTRETPPIDLEDPPGLWDLQPHPAGLARIIRKAVRSSPSDRYRSVEELRGEVARHGSYQEVGLAHPEVEEQNLGVLSFRPAAPEPAKPEKPRKARAKKAKKKRARELKAKRARRAKTTRAREAKTSRASTRKPAEKAQRRTFEASGLPAGMRALLLVAGLAGISAACALSYFASVGLLARVLLSLAVGMIGFAALPFGMHKESTVRFCFGLFLATALFAVNPTPYFAHMGDVARLRSADANVRQASFRKLAARQLPELAGANLSNINLEGQQFYKLDLTETSFEGADLTYVNFIDCDLHGTRFRNATIAGGGFYESPVDNAIDFEHAKCDHLTVLPEGWMCAEGNPKEGRPK